MSILKEVKTSVIVTLVLLIVCSGIYPLIVWSVGRCFSEAAEGQQFGPDATAAHRLHAPRSDF